MESQNSNSLVDLIFAKCALVYGRDFAGRWEGINMAEVKEDWRRELGRFLNDPQAIKYALARLPEKPPHVLTFRALCLSAPQEPAERPKEIARTPEQIEASKEIRRRAMASLTFIKPNRPRGDESEAA